MTLADAITDYVNFITHERRLAKSTTVTQYASNLRQLLRWLDANGYPDPSLDAFNVQTLRRYLYSISAEGRRPRTIRGRFHPIMGLGEFLVANAVMSDNPAKALTMPKKDAAQRTMVTEQEVRLLLDAAERLPNPRKIALTRSVLSVFIFAGLRRAELLNLRVGDVHFSERCLLVRNGKGSKSRQVFVGDTCLNALREWQTFRTPGLSHDFLFLADRSRRLSECGLKSLFDAVKACAGMAERDYIQPHSIRHQFASRLLARGADIKSISTALGHSHLQTTAIYLHLNEAQAKQVADYAELLSLPQEEAKTPQSSQEGQSRNRLRRRTI